MNRDFYLTQITYAIGAMKGWVDERGIYSNDYYSIEIEDVLELFESPHKKTVYPLFAVCSDGDILRDGKFGGEYELAGVTWKMQKQLPEQKKDVLKYIYRSMWFSRKDYNNFIFSYVPSLLTPSKQ